MEQRRLYLISGKKVPNYEAYSKNKIIDGYFVF